MRIHVVTRSLSTPADQVIRRVRADTSTLRPVPRPASATHQWSCPGAGARPGPPPVTSSPAVPQGQCLVTAVPITVAVVTTVEW